MTSHIVSKGQGYIDDMFNGSTNTSGSGGKSNREIGFDSFKEYLQNYFTDLSKFDTQEDQNLQSNNDYDNWIRVFETSGKNRKMHILYYNLINNLKNYTKIYYLFNRQEKSANDPSLAKMMKMKKKANNDRKNQKNINLRMARYYDRDIEDYKNYTSLLKYIYYFILGGIFVIFLVRSQYTNLKILLYILLLFLISYAINPIYDLVNELTYNFNRTIQLIANYSIMLLIFILFISFKYFVFQDEDGNEGKRDAYILTGILSVGFLYVLINYFFYGIGIKSLLKA